MRTGKQLFRGSGFAATYGKVDSCRQGERMDEGFASRKEAPREGLVERVSWSCRSVTPPKCMCIATAENKSGRETARVV